MLKGILTSRKNEIKRLGGVLGGVFNSENKGYTRNKLRFILRKHAKNAIIRGGKYYGFISYNLFGYILKILFISILYINKRADQFQKPCVIRY